MNNDLAKPEIRDYSKQLGIVTYNKPSNACLSSRFDYNTELTLEKLKLVETGEIIPNSSQAFNPGRYTFYSM